MNRLLFRRLLFSFYSTAKWLVNKKMPERIIPTTVHLFLTSLTFLVSGLYVLILGSISFRFKSFTPILVGFIIICIGIGYGLDKPVKKALPRWGIERDYKDLTKTDRINTYLLASVVFWGSFVLFFCLGVTFIGGYLVN